MYRKKLHSKEELKKLRSVLRKSLTPAEAYLWSKLKARQFKGIRFTKQHSIGYYIVDFYCAEYKLIIELDGEIHNTPNQFEKDEIRTQYLEGLGYKVIRFENKMAFENLPSIYMEIEDQINNL
ncbi:endonuclease domain-containing protein [Lacinutrix sp. Bg11-31]|uniref:endonuclease domain-containing protein n=1 Tax=Lacinutrix sp. Bg11-31 TaxID=2057808 RepID=UPI000C30072E|nr:endonuclease domain-containing protein [Lacinutrix sp. Bg11-31]AUC81504.1 cytosine methyltransferase [Lacinutrix sp. Bg11-31]